MYQKNFPSPFLKVKQQHEDEEENEEKEDEDDDGACLVAEAKANREVQVDTNSYLFQ